MFHFETRHSSNLLFFSYSFFPFLLPFSYILFFYASFHFLSLKPSLCFAPLLCLTVSFLNHASLCFFLISPQSFAYSRLSFFLCFPLHQLFALSACQPFPVFCPFLRASQSHLLGGWTAVLMHANHIKISSKWSS